MKVAVLDFNENNNIEIEVQAEDIYSPVFIHLSKEDKENIANMHPDACIFAAFPDNLEPKQIDQIREAMVIFKCSHKVKGTETATE